MARAQALGAGMGDRAHGPAAGEELLARTPLPRAQGPTLALP
jgi:hypothetical protein